MRKVLVLVAFLFVLSPGCIANMGELKDRLGADGEPVETAVVDLTPVALPVPPEARMRIVSALGIVYDGGANDSLVPILVNAGQELTLQAVSPGPNVTAIAWRAAGQDLTGAQTALTLTAPGLYPVVLTVTTNRGLADNHTVVLGVAPQPVTIETPFSTDAIVGAQEAGQKGTAAFTLDPAASGVPDAKVTAFVVKLDAPANCDLTLDVLDPTGTSLGKVNKAGAGEAETRTLETPFREGAYTFEAIPVACVAHEGTTGTVSVTYLQVIPGLEAVATPADEHAGHAGH